MLEDDFDPVSLTLKLMDDSSVGKKKDYKAFQRILYNLDMALKTIVNDYYRGFNNSIGTFGGVLQYINDSSNRVVHIKNNLKRCKEDLLLKRNDLLNLWYKSQQYKEMLSILETIEELRTTPEKIDALMENKQVLSASKLVSRSLKQAMNKDMMQIGALDDIRRNLKSQKNLLYDTLIEELHNHLYLKNPYCDSRWTAYTPGQQDLPEISVKPRQMDQNQTKDARTVQEVLVEENDILAEDPDKNPDTDSYYYMELIMESLLVLGEISSALQTIQERLPVEVHTLVDKTIAEVEQRHSNQWSHYTHQIQSYHNKDNHSGYSMIDKNNSDEYDIYCLDKANSEAKNEILKDLLWTLFSKLKSVLTGHRFVETCARHIKQRLLSGTMIDLEEGSGSSINIYHFHEIWKPIQSEIKSLLQDYLTNSYQNIVSVNDPVVNTNASNNISQNKFFSFAAETAYDDSYTNDRNDEDTEATYDDLKQKLFLTFKRKQIPGFDPSTIHTHSTIIDKYAINNMSSKGHKVLIKPDAYNVSILLKPTMSFLSHVKEVFPDYDDRNEEAFGSFLDDFAVNVFLPQIEEKVMQLIQHATVGIDAFQDARDYHNYSKYPITKSAVALISVIQSLCRTMHIMPFHTDEYVRLIEVVLLKFYEKCYQRFYSTVAKGASSIIDSSTNNNVTDVTISTSGDWAQDESLVGLLCQNSLFDEDTASDPEFIKALHQAEINMELKLKNDRVLETNELMFEPKKHIALGRLYHTIKWFVREIWTLRSPSVKEATAVKASNQEQQQYHPTNGLKNTKRWSTQDMPPQPVEEGSSPTVDESQYNTLQVSLALTEDIAKRFDALLTTYQQLAETCLFTLRIEARNHTMYYLELAIRDGNYYLEDETFEPDPYIITLNADLMELSESVNASLPPRDEEFVFDGLPRLIVHLLISEASYIKRLNKNGIQKMLRNILALQQNMNNLVPTSQCSIMERAKEYYQIFQLGSEGIIKSIQENGPKFSFDEYRILLGLIHDINLDQDDEQQQIKHNSCTAADSNTTTYDEVRKANHNKYSEWLLELVEVMADYEN
ncbi:Sec8 exocyst complex component-specific domain-containing protein [Mycotypha africana]|uniref:Sec8 exocyst complex component-specific domain-containing protein n=1 Tax=Mycotypha africana TaxID=64632 RepID=UPI002300B570|nr:Sec8 exocyst complex component-specific domain-containing protein [Mycotypha africana]KAI8991536.1 Sec8 exocyst complex component-specific domain-containing protein [Mycotypha africana]